MKIHFLISSANSRFFEHWQKLPVRLGWKNCSIYYGAVWVRKAKVCDHVEWGVGGNSCWWGKQWRILLNIEDFHVQVGLWWALKLAVLHDEREQFFLCCLIPLLSISLCYVKHRHDEKSFNQSDPFNLFLLICKSFSLSTFCTFSRALSGSLS